MYEKFNVSVAYAFWSKVGEKTAVFPLRDEEFGSKPILQSADDETCDEEEPRSIFSDEFILYDRGEKSKSAAGSLAV